MLRCTPTVLCTVLVAISLGARTISSSGTALSQKLKVRYGVQLLSIESLIEIHSVSSI
jgi:hypothetical protein